MDADAYRSARSDPGLVVLEGFHAIKHALRFGGVFVDMVAEEGDTLAGLIETCAPDLKQAFTDRVRHVPAGQLKAIGVGRSTGAIVAIARRPACDAEALWRCAAQEAPLVVLDRPQNLGNVGAVIRTAAAAGAAGVLVHGDLDPWHPTVLRGAAGLHFAVDVARLADLPATDRPVIAITPEGEPLRRDVLPDGAALIFGSERTGLDSTLIARADRSISLPMKQHVSSLNLGVCVGIILYSVLPGSSRF